MDSSDFASDIHPMYLLCDNLTQLLHSMLKLNIMSKQLHSFHIMLFISYVIDTKGHASYVFAM